MWHSARRMTKSRLPITLGEDRSTSLPGEPSEYEPRAATRRTEARPDGSAPLAVEAMARAESRYRLRPHRGHRGTGVGGRDHHCDAGPLWRPGALRAAGRGCG